MEKEKTMKQFMIFVTLFTCLGVASAASFDCSKASTSVEKAICSHEKLSAYDSELAHLYNELQDKLAKDQFEEVRSDQRNWIKERNKCGDSFDCIEDAYYDRIFKLKKILFVMSPVIQNISGTYESDTGELTVQQKTDGKILFSIITSNYDCSGDVEGNAFRKNNIVEWGDEYCKIKMIFAEDKVLIEEEDCSYHGTNCWFSGLYEKQYQTETSPQEPTQYESQPEIQREKSRDAASIPGCNDDDVKTIVMDICSKQIKKDLAQYIYIANQQQHGVLDPERSRKEAEKVYNQSGIDLHNIRTVSKDHELKKSGCKAQLSGSGETWNIIYNAQLTEDGGNIFVEVRFLDR